MTTNNDLKNHFPRVELIQFEGKAGGFAMKETKLYRLVLVNASGMEHKLSILGQDDTSDLCQAKDMAAYWAGFLNWDVVHTKEVRHYVNIKELVSVMSTATKRK